MKTCFILFATAAYWVAPCRAYRAQVKTDQSLLHPALQTSVAEIDKFWGRGALDEGRKVEESTVENNFVFSIGSVSTVTWLSPALIAYHEGFESVRERWPAARIGTAKQALENEAAVGTSQIVFSGKMEIAESTIGRNRIKGTPTQLRSLQFVLGVGTKNYLPVAQPGDLSFQSLAADQTLIDHPTVATNYYTVERRPEETVYRAYYRIVFSAFNPDGTPRVSPNDVTFDVKPTPPPPSDPQNHAKTGTVNAAKMDAYIRS